MKSPSPQAGYVALLSVLVLGAISLAASLILLISSADTQRAAAVADHAVQARSMADTCTDEALQQIHDNPDFTGTQNYLLGPYGCTFTVTSAGSNNYSIASSASISNVTRKVLAYASIQSSQIGITSWQEVSDF
ncbi:MAG TPA: hypothetical protein VFT53_00470 [Candidatus Saccharimonadales bacterium]|nr:hypothetical protein [Candidatus Saccharimonadales bacterium]